MALNPAAWSAIDTARADLAAKRDLAADAFDAAEQAKVALAEAQRTLSGSDLDPFTQAVTSTGNALITARGNEGTARQTLLNALSAWVPTTLSLDDDIKRLPANAPFVMFPIRIETKFGVNNGAPALFVRIYPDEIFLNTHETALTRAERDAAMKYFRDLGDHDGEGQAWRELTRTIDPRRAAYVLRVMQPHDPGSSISITFFDTDPHPEHQGMLFPTPKLRPSGWTRPGEAILPDRWVFQLTNGPVTRTVYGPAIPEPLSMTPDPSIAEGELVPVPATNGALKIDPKILWTVDYAEAVRVGMALTIPITATEAVSGFERLTVFGVKTSIRSDAGSRIVEKLLDAHHYTRGLALVSQGSPTNNTEDAPTPVSHAEDDPDETFHLERDPPPSFADAHDYRLSADDDGDFLARALGVPNGTFLNVAGARQDPLLGPPDQGTNPAGPAREQTLAAKMISVLYEVLFGHFGRDMLGWTAPQQDQAKSWVTRFVRARGPAPAIRIGTVPYGILPALSIQQWGTRATSDTVSQGLENTMVTPLRHLRERWKAAALAQAPRVTPSSVDPSGDMMKALAMYPSAREARIRNVTKQLYAYHQTTFFGFDFQSVINRVAQAVSGVLQRAAIPQWATKPIATVIFDASSSRFTGDMVAPAALMSETTPLAGNDNYLVKLALANDIAAVLADTIPITNTKATVFYKLLRHALILENYKATLALVQQRGVPVNGNITIDFGIFRELVSIRVPTPPPTGTFTPSALMLATASEISSNMSIGNFVLTGAFMDPWQNTVGELAGVPTAELERLFTETMDLASHRLDAWITAFATRRLAEMRVAQMASSSKFFPTGDYIGGYGYVENLHPTTRSTDPTTGLPIQIGNGGLIHAPSMTHASAAGVLRNGYLTHKDSDGQKCAVDLSSARVRAAKLVMDELRNDQNLGAVIGYRFERRLQERAQAIIATDPMNAGAIQNYRYTLRNRFPLVANKQSTPPAGATADQLAARNVVDGVALRNAFKATPSTVNPEGDIGGIAGPIVRQELNALDDLVDGVADLVTAESILHFVRGNTSRAAGTLDALAHGARPPEEEMVRSVLRGTGLTFKTALLLPDDIPNAWTGVVTYRAEVDFKLDQWIGALLGNPTNVVCQATVLKPDNTSVVRQVSLAQLQYREKRGPNVAPTTKALRPTDVVALARAVAQANEGSLLDRWITTAAVTAAGEQVTTIDYARVGTNLTFPEAMEVAMTIGQLLAGARALRPEDLVAPGELATRRDELEAGAHVGAGNVGSAATNATTFLTRASALLTAATEATATEDDRRIALENASAFVASAYPARTMTDEQLVALIPPVIAELDRRIAQVAAEPPIPALPATTIFAGALARLRDIFGLETFATYTFEPPAGGEIKQSFDAIAAGLQSEQATDQPTIFLQQATEVRDGLARWRRLALYVGALGAGRPIPRLDVAQLPSVPGERWIGLPFSGTQSPPPINGFSPLIYSYGAAAPNAGSGTFWSGLLIDDWTEIVPRAQEETGIAFHYDSPGAEAPQAIIVVVPSSTGQLGPSDPQVDGWKGTDFSATLSETFDLAKIRSVDAQMIDFGQLFPTIYLTENFKGAIPTSNWLNQLFTRLGLRI